MNQLFVVIAPNAHMHIHMHSGNFQSSCNT